MNEPKSVLRRLHSCLIISSRCSLTRNERMSLDFHLFDLSDATTAIAIIVSPRSHIFLMSCQSENRPSAASVRSPVIRCQLQPSLHRQFQASPFPLQKRSAPVVSKCASDDSQCHYSSPFIVSIGFSSVICLATDFYSHEQKQPQLRNFLFKPVAPTPANASVNAVLRTSEPYNLLPCFVPNSFHL